LVILADSDPIQQAKEGKQQAFNSLLETHWDYVFNFLKTIINDEYMVEEICIQTFERAFDKINQYDENYTFRTWLTTIGRNLWIDENRKKEIKTSEIGHNEDALQSEETNIDEVLVQKQYLSTIESNLKKLKPFEREILQLRWFEDKSYAEIASQMDVSENLIKVRLLRAKRKLFGHMKL